MKERLDTLLVSKGFFESREKAKSNILAGNVFVNGQKAFKAGEMADEDAQLAVKEMECAFVSRGGLKLQKALDEFGIDVSGKVGLDIGASTGGFSDCMLKRGLKKVYAVDVGYGQLDWRLRNDARVVTMERQNARFLTRAMFAEGIDVVTIDASFISLALLLPAVYEVVEEGAQVVALIKPQFEAGKGEVGKRGVVKDARVHKSVIDRVVEQARGTGFSVLGLTFSPIKGPNGNIEYLIHLKKGDFDGETPDSENIVKKAHIFL